MTPAELARFIDFPLLRADATARDLEQHCAIARQCGFAAVVVNGCRVERARHCLDGSEVKVVAAIAFPLGAMDPDAKRYEVEAAMDSGAQEIDAVLNAGRLKDGDDKFVLRELRDLAEAADERPVRIVLETGLLTRDELVRALGLVLDSGARGVVASAGFGDGRPSVDDVQWLREVAGPDLTLKASGAIASPAEARALIAAGVTRLGAAAGASLLRDPAPAS